MNEGDDRKTNDANTKQLYQSLLAEQLALESREGVVGVCLIASIDNNKN